MEIHQFDPEVDFYVSKFLEEGRLRGVDMEKETSRIIWEWVNDPNIGYYGLSVKKGLKRNRIKINYYYWKDSSDEFKEWLIFHELGHSVLDKKHTETEGSFMHPTPRLSIVTDFEKRSDSLDVLFE
jgi:Zn-dependent peptidase ImmA (M78 family)